MSLDQMRDANDYKLLNRHTVQLSEGIIIYGAKVVHAQSPKPIELMSLIFNSLFNGSAR